MNIDCMHVWLLIGRVQKPLCVQNLTSKLFEYMRLHFTSKDEGCEYKRVVVSSILRSV